MADLIGYGIPGSKFNTRKVKLHDFKKLPKVVNGIGWIKDYFLTGGCWGMALAVYDLLKKQGYSPKLKINYGTGTIHAYVEVMGKGIDATGVFNAASEEWVEDKSYSIKEFKQIARDYGPPSVPQDRKSAAWLLENLVE